MATAFQATAFQRSPAFQIDGEGPQSSHVWKRRSKRGTALQACKPTTDYQARLRLGVNAVILQLRPPAPIAVSLRAQYDGLYFVNLNADVAWPEGDAVALRHLLEFTSGEATKSSTDYRVRLQLGVELDPQEPRLDDLLLAVDAIEDRQTVAEPPVASVVSPEPIDNSLAVAWLQSFSGNEAIKSEADYKARLKLKVESEADEALSFPDWLNVD